MFIDTHAHLYLDKFNEDRPKVIQRALEKGVKKIVLPNIDLTTIDDMFDMYVRYTDICYPTVGLHPCSVNKDFDRVLGSLYHLIRKEGVVAIGEIGIDLYWDDSLSKEQEDVFRQQIGWARESQLPIIIHSRNSIEKTTAIVAEEQKGDLTGIFHCFSEDIDIAKRIVDMNFCMGIGGVSTFKKSEEFRKTMAYIPLEYIVLETDAPYLAPVPFRGKSNESAYIPCIAEVVAQSKNIDIEQVAIQTSQNAVKIFNF